MGLAFDALAGPRAPRQIGGPLYSRDEVNALTGKILNMVKANPAGSARRGVNSNLRLGG